MASKRGLRRKRECGGKDKLMKRQAMRVALAMTKKSPTHPFDAYRCPFCGNNVWHVGHRRRFTQEKINARRSNK